MTLPQKIIRWVVIVLAAFGVYILVGTLGEEARQDTIDQIKVEVEEIGLDVKGQGIDIKTLLRQVKIGGRCSDRQILLALEDLATQAGLEVEAINPPSVSKRNCDVIFQDLPRPHEVEGDNPSGESAGGNGNGGGPNGGPGPNPDPGPKPGDGEPPGGDGNGGNGGGEEPDPLPSPSPCIPNPAPIGPECLPVPSVPLSQIR